MTELEQKIYDCCQSNSNLTAHQISHRLKLNGIYGTKGKQIVGMTIARMRKKGITVSYRQ